MLWGAVPWGARFAASLISTAALSIGAGAEEPPRLALPIDCQLGTTCFLQNYVDIDPGPGAKDYACGSATYDGHLGTDFRVLSAEAADGVDVLAAADGTVLRLRDGMPDRLLRDYRSKAELQSIVSKKKCGNGVFIDHGGGWTTQYCHLKRGSVAVKKGQAVKQGDRLGTVGFSGMANFAHVHISVRHNDQVIDPFIGRAIGEKCQEAGKASGALWRDDLAKQLRYSGRTIIDAGFAAEPPKHDRLEADHRVAPPERGSPALVFYARVINLKAGDRLKIAVRGPNGFRVDNTSKPFDRNKALQMVYAGKKLTKAQWAAGHYEGAIAVLHSPSPGGAAKILAARKVSFELQ